VAIWATGCMDVQNMCAEDNNLRNKEKDNGNFYLSNVRYGLRGRVGWREMDLFVNYDLNQVFTSGNGPELNAFSFGIIL
jgi:hypothetical protein